MAVRNFIVIVLVLAAGAFYAWLPRSLGIRWLSRSPSSYYAQLGDSLAAGQLNLPIQPDPHLPALADPYSPTLNAPYRINGLSYFHGRYYLYNGVAPALVLYLPVKWLTGWHLNDAGACLLLVWGGLIANFALIQAVRSHCFPACSLSWFVAGALALVLANGYQAELRNAGTVSQVAVSAAYFFSAVAMWAAARSLFAGRSPRPWFCVCGLAYALAIASRPNYAWGGVALIIPVLGRPTGTTNDSVTRRLLDLSAFASPALAVLAGMLAYNWARFASPWELGAHYMLGAWDQRHLPMFDLRPVATNAWHYFLAPANYAMEFPFASPPDEFATGVLLHQPFVLFALLIPWAIWRPVRDRARDRACTVLTLALGGVLLANLTSLLLLPSGDPQSAPSTANSRYVMDFQPVLTLLAVLGLFATVDRLAPRSWGRRLLAVGTWSLLGVTGLATVSLDLSGLPADAYRKLARILDEPSAWYWHLRGVGYGPVRLIISVPSDRTGVFEPILESGGGLGKDLLYIHYESRDSIQLGLVGTGIRGPISRSISLDYALPHQLEISLGSMYPSSASPSLSHFRPREIDLLKRTVQVKLDGRLVFSAPARFHPATPTEWRIGTNTGLPGYSADRFSGTWSRLERLPIAALAPPPQLQTAYGPIRLTVRFPVGLTGTAEPLVVTGASGAGDTVYVRYASATSIRLGLDHWGQAGYLSDPIPIDYAGDHVVDVFLDSLLPPMKRSTAALSSSPQPRFQLRLDGKLVLSADQSAFDSLPEDVTIGKNLIGSTTCGYAFSGTIRSRARLPLPGSDSNR